MDRRRWVEGRRAPWLVELEELEEEEVKVEEELKRVAGVETK